MENEKGMFFFEGYMDAILSISSDAGKWRMVKAIYDYEVYGVEPSQKILKSGIFLLARAVIDGRKASKEKRKGGSRARKNEVVIKGVVENVFSGSQKVIESGNQVNQEVGIGRPLYNKNKNKNENKNENSSSNENKKNKESAIAEHPPYNGEESGVVPTLDEVKKFVKVSKLEVEAEAFFYYYESKHWIIRNKPVKDWKALLLSWGRRQKKENVKSSSSEPQEGYYRKLLNEVGEEEFNKMLFDDIDKVEI